MVALYAGLLLCHVVVFAAEMFLHEGGDLTITRCLLENQFISHTHAAGL